TTDGEFRQSIGFDKANPNGWMSVLTFRNLGALARESMTRFVYDRIGKPDPGGYFLGQFRFLERNNREISGEGRELVTNRLRNIKEIADHIGSRLLIAMVPAAPQVCGPNFLSYWPRGTDLSDTTRFDPELPQRTTQNIAAQLSIPTLDLRVP